MASLQKCWTRRVQPPLLRHLSKRAYSRSFEAHAASRDNFENGDVPRRLGRVKAGPKELESKSFADLGLHPPLVSALRVAFSPEIQHPTQSQEVLIPAVLGGHDIFLQDQTGAGKSFGLVLALLNRPRQEERKSGRPTITSIFILPHRDLAYQLHHWVERLFAPAASAPKFSINSIAQVLVRDSRGSSLSILRENPPHLLFSTPQAIMDAWREEPDALQLKTLSAIVVDEADYLIKLKQKQHPGDTREFLNIVYGNNTKPLGDEDAPPNERDRSPQLILSSATLPPHLVEYVSEESSWLNRDNWVNISGASSTRQVKSQVTHAVLVVSEDEVRNIAGAIPSPPTPDEFRPVTGVSGTDDPVAELDPAVVQKYEQRTSPFNPLALETIAMVFAADVPSTALLVIPAAASVQRAIYDLQALGVNAHSMDLLKRRSSGHGAVRDNPILLVSTWASTRGLDVQELSHVFILGVPDDGATAYVHMAGRVGRLGSAGKRRRGKVVMVVPPSEEDAARKLLASVKQEAVEIHFEL